VPYLNIVPSKINFYLQIIYDLTQPPNSRIISVHVQCAACQVPMYNKLQRNATYNVLLTDFIAKGGDGFDMLKDIDSVSLGIFISTYLHLDFIPYGISSLEECFSLSNNMYNQSH